MHKPYKMIKDAVRTYPLSLATLKDEKLIKFANDIVPYETGIEIECDLGSVINLEIAAIPGIVSSDCSDTELRIRIKSGIEGMIALYNALEYIKEHTVPNFKSGIHYHIDCRDMSLRGRGNSGMGSSVCDYIIDDHQAWILNALEHWGYKGLYNRREVSISKTMVKLHKEYDTMEFRIGEMSFDYSLIIKRIINCQNIVRVIKRSMLRVPTKKYPMDNAAFEALVNARHDKYEKMKREVREKAKKRAARERINRGKGKRKSQKKSCTEAEQQLEEQIIRAVDTIRTSSSGTSTGINPALTAFASYISNNSNTNYDLPGTAWF